MMSLKNDRTPDGLPKFKFGLTWLIVIPGGVWAIMTYYLPVFGGTLLTPYQTRAATPIILILLAASVVVHVGAHLWTARLMGLEPPPDFVEKLN